MELTIAFAIFYLAWKIEESVDKIISTVNDKRTKG